MNEEQLQYLERVVSELDQEWFTIRLEEVRALIAKAHQLQRELEETRCVRNDRFVDRGEYTAVKVERDALRRELENSKAGAWATVQNTVSNARIWDMHVDVDSWHVRSSLTDYVGVGETLCDAVAKLGYVIDDDVPEVPA